MPWKESESMDPRREFALKAIGTLNFRELCREYGISTKMRLAVAPVMSKENLPTAAHPTPTEIRT
jgi:hypothetical protein